MSTLVAMNLKAYLFFLKYYLIHNFKLVGRKRSLVYNCTIVMLLEGFVVVFVAGAANVAVVVL